MTVADWREDLKPAFSSIEAHIAQLERERDELREKLRALELVADLAVRNVAAIEYRGAMRLAEALKLARDPFHSNYIHVYNIDAELKKLGPEVAGG